jgi:excinuclease ABC subunit C
MNIDSLPKISGVYLFKDANDQIIYIGKAKSIQKRVASYFRKSVKDWKIQALIDEHATIDYIVTQHETEALLLEAKLIREHKPKYNVLLKSGQPFVYIMITKPNDKQVSLLQLVRNKQKPGIYVGPFLHKTQARSVYNFLMNTFRLVICNKHLEHGCLDYHLDRCSGSCLPDFDKQGYEMRLRLALDVLKDDRTHFIKAIKEHIKRYNTELAFEKARHLHEYLEQEEVIFQTIKTKFSEKKFADEEFVVSTPTKHLIELGHHAGTVLQELLDAHSPIMTIDCFDISHFQSSYLTGACIRFTQGQPDKHNFRRFKIKTLQQQNDYAALQEVIVRRYQNDHFPDLILIDGGKGQLHAAQQVAPMATIVSLAKREETLFSSQFPEGIKLDVKTDVGKLLIALRDYTHHFAISYHRLRRKKEFTA